jgi:hypothetical protein
MINLQGQIPMTDEPPRSTLIGTTKRFDLGPHARCTGSSTSMHEIATTGELA